MNSFRYANLNFLLKTSCWCIDCIHHWPTNYSCNDMLVIWTILFIAQAFVSTLLVKRTIFFGQAFFISIYNAMVDFLIIKNDPACRRNFVSPEWWFCGSVLFSVPKESIFVDLLNVEKGGMLCRTFFGIKKVENSTWN